MNANSLHNESVLTDGAGHRERSPTLAQLPPPPPGKTGWPWTQECPALPDVMPDGSPWPRLSIVTPSYNQGQFIEETIRSVLLQGYRELEYTIIDGGSTDDSLSVIRKYEPWLAYWTSEPDDGQSDAINKGFGRATGEIVAWLNSDDLYRPGALSATARFYGKYPRTDLTYGAYVLVDQNGRQTRRLQAPRFDMARLTLWNYIPQPTVFMRRQVLDRIGYLDRSLHYVMDYDYWLRAAIFGLRIERITRYIANFREHGTSKSVSHETRFWVETAQVFDRMFGQRELPAELHQIERRARAHLHWNTALCFQRAGLRSEAQAHAARSVDTYGLTMTAEDLDFAVGQLLHARNGRLLTPSCLKARFQELNSGSDAFSYLHKLAVLCYRIAFVLQICPRRVANVVWPVLSRLTVRLHTSLHRRSAQPKLC
jgi:GT2 family glycosyltransferase